MYQIYTRQETKREEDLSKQIIPTTERKKDLPVTYNYLFRRLSFHLPSQRRRRKTFFLPEKVLSRAEERRLQQPREERLERPFGMFSSSFSLSLRDKSMKSRRDGGRQIRRTPNREETTRLLQRDKQITEIYRDRQIEREMPREGENEVMQKRTGGKRRRRRVPVH